LLPGHYDTWIMEERDRLAGVFEQASARVQSAPVQRAGTAQTAAPSASAQPVTPGQPWRQPPPAGVQRRLPSYATSFFGRESEVQRLADTFLQHRLVTLVGPAGSGKTRLSLEFASHAEGFGRIAFVPLSVCRTPAAVHEHVRLALGLAPAPTPALDQIAAALEATPALLVLDNLEHLLPRGRAPCVACVARPRAQPPPAGHVAEVAQRTDGHATRHRAIAAAGPGSSPR
jgi:hypothetical protein